MSESEFCKQVDDLLRYELSHLGYEYAAVVRTLVANPSTDGCIVRMLGELDDFEVLPQDKDLPTDVLSAQIARKLKVSLLGTTDYGPPLDE